MMSSETVIVYGPTRCGKTYASKTMARVFNCNQIIDNWVKGDEIKTNALHLFTGELLLPDPNDVYKNLQQPVTLYTYKEAIELVRNENS